MTDFQSVIKEPSENGQSITSEKLHRHRPIAFYAIRSMIFKQPPIIAVFDSGSLSQHQQWSRDPGIPREPFVAEFNDLMKVKPGLILAVVDFNR